jgi:hypothetical protein
MARENQDLQIALIVSVMLTIVLGVATFLCYRQYTDTAKSLKTAQEDNNKKQTEAQAAGEEVKELKRLIGAAESDKIEDVRTQFTNDMKKYGGAYPQESQFYRPLLEKMLQTKQDLEKELLTAKTEIDQLKDKYATREAGKDAQLKQFDDKMSQVTQDLSSRSETFRKDVERKNEEANKIREQLQAAQKDAASLSAKLEAKYQEIEAELKKTRQIAQKLRKENTEITNQTLDVPDGEIRWVNQRNGTVWIDVGKADNLNMLTSFAVFPADISNLGKGAKKAGIEVTQILGDHLAEARIIDDSASDPIMPGDKIYTPIWSPGDKRHFALAGFMDLNDDGTNNLALLRNLININGGVVDCEVDDKGKRTGNVTIQTRYLVLGEDPSEKSDPNAIAEYTKLREESQKLGVQTISLKELLDRMGYKPQSHVVNFGTGANPKDFKPKPEGGVNRVSSGNVSEIFKPRQPPRSGTTTGGAY